MLPELVTALSVCVYCEFGYASELQLVTKVLGGLLGEGSLELHVRVGALVP